MKRFTQLFQAVDATTSTNAKVQALQDYFQTEKPRNAVWALYLLLGKTRRRLVTSRVLREVFLQISDIPEWLFKDCYAHVGDSAEAIALLLKNVSLEAEPLDLPLHVWMEEVIPTVKQVETEAELRDLIVSWWASLAEFEVFVLNKVLTGAFRFGASSKLVIRALARAYDLPEAVLTHRLMGDFEPTAEFFQQLVSAEAAETAPSQPYPFFLASQIDEAKFQLEDLSRWQAEWKWDGIRAQIIRRAGEAFIWSRGEDLVTHQFPELETCFLENFADGLVFDGEIVCWDGDRPMNFNALQKRLGRKRVSKKLMQESPVHFIAYDLLEHQGQDIREKPLRDRRQYLFNVLDQSSADCVSPSQVVIAESFEQLQQLRGRSRSEAAEGLMLKALDSPYLVGRKRGYWWKYKVEPMTLDAVLIYAQAGSGKRANLFTDYTFALWREDELVPFAKAYSGLDNAEIEKLDRWIRRHTVERFGPVRSVEPIHVFEIGFEGIAESSRHKSGISVRFPRILRWRHDKPAKEADTLQSALALLSIEPAH
ncbi:ATP-dependent DNA ligase [Sphaerothrix gracilis]|uniref:ATP-dependent DNA ligase n=1 Tax=Sphaerothrix gracilis TaxID=3151835 RepID=UPI0031FD004B